MFCKVLVMVGGLFSAIGCYAYAGGNVSYREEVAPLVSARPDLSLSLKGLEMGENGNGTRISYLMCPGLAGQRVGPYEFPAVDEVTHRNRIVQFRTRDRFLNAYGVVVAEFFDGEQIAGGDISSAVKVQEELVGITVE